MKKQTKHQYYNMMQVYRKMHEEVAQLAQQVLELEDEEYNLSSDILYEVSNILYEVSEKLYGHYNFAANVDWLFKLNDTRKFLIVCLMFLNGYIEEDDVYEAWYRYLDKKQELNSYFYYTVLLYINHILPL